MPAQLLVVVCGVSAVPVLGLCEKQKQMSVLLLSPSQGGSVSCLTWPPVTHTPELLRRRDSNLWTAFLEPLPKCPAAAGSGG